MRFEKSVEIDASQQRVSLDMRGLFIPVVALFCKGLTNDYMNLEAQGMKRAAETP